MAHRKWKEIKQQPSMLLGPAVPGCCLVSFHFLWVILSTSTVQGDNGGQRLRFVVFILEVPQSCATAILFLITLHLPKQNRADYGTTKFKSTKPSLGPPWSPCTMLCSVGLDCWTHFKELSFRFPEVHNAKRSRRQEALTEKEVSHHHRNARQCDQEEDLLLDPWFTLCPAHRLISWHDANCQLFNKNLKLVINPFI